MSMRNLSDILNAIDTEITTEKVSMSDLLEVFHERGFGFFLFFFALPAALPIPAVGVGTILGMPLLFLTAQQAVGRHTIWFPEKIKHKTISKTKINSFTKAAMPWVKRIEKLVKPRLEFITQGGFSKLIGILGFIMAIAVCIPLPLTNTIPSLGIALMAVGILMRDGLAVLAGAAIGIAWVILLCGIIIFLGTDGIEIAKEFIKGLL